MLSVCVSKASRSIASIIAVSCLAASLACGPEDYQKPITGFQEASSSVIAADRIFLANENTIEESKFIDQMVFEQKPFGPEDIDKQTIITPEEIKLRTAALDALSKYTVNLAALASGKPATAVGTDCKTLSTNLQGLAKDASARPNPNKSQAAFNTKFSGVAGAAASAIGAVAQLIIEHKARVEIEKSVTATDHEVTELINLISDDANGSYLRQKSQLSIYGVQLYKDYSCEITPTDASPARTDGVQCPKRAAGSQADPIALLALADRIKSFRSQQTTLENANPGPAIEKMRKAHENLVAYVTHKNPETQQQLLSSIQDFLKAAQPLGQACQDLVKATK
jgi:hypothetical protein